MPLPPGTRLGTYEILGPLGAGGMGEVYRARDTRLRRDVAVKVLPSEVASYPDRLARLEREARMVAGLNHPNIVTLFSVEDQEGIRFLTMELVEGQSLVNLVTPGGLPLARVLELSIPLVDALVAAHERGVIHRDLKPGNVMVTREGRVKVLDFGLARLTGAHAPAQDETLTAEPPISVEGKVLGTVPYMAPEQIRGESADARSDLFALGIILYELAAGRRPFRGATSVEVSSSILRDTPEPLTRLRADLPGDLERIVSRCLEKDPRERIQSALDVNSELRRLRRVLEHGEPEGLTSDKVASAAVSTGAGGLGRVLRSAQRPLPLGIGLALVGIALAIGLNVAGLRDRLWPPAVDARTLLILPIEVRGQVEGADYAGRAFAEEVAMNLTKGKDLTILPVPEPGELGKERGMAHVRTARKVRAGLVLTGTLSREREALRARLSLVGTAENRILWGAEEDSPEGDLSQLAVILSRKLLSHFGATGTRVYENHHYETPSPAVMATQEFVEARTGLRNVNAPVQATARLVERFPDDPLVRVMRADALLQDAWGASAGSRKRRLFEESLAAIDRVDRNNPWDDMFRALYYAFHDGKVREAVEEFNRLLARDDLAPSGRAHILTFRGSAKAELDGLEGGIADLEEAMRLTPANDHTQGVLASMLANEQRYEEAWAHARQAVALNPTSYQNQSNLGWISLRMEKWEDALPALERACQGRTATDWDYAGWAIALWRTGRQEEARRVAQQAASLPETIEGNLELGIYHAQAGNRSEALRRLHRYMENKPTFTPREARSLAEEPLLEPLHGDPDFEAVVAVARRRAHSQR